MRWMPRRFWGRWALRAREARRGGGTAVRSRARVGCGGRAGSGRLTAPPPPLSPGALQVVQVTWAFSSGPLRKARR